MTTTPLLTPTEIAQALQAARPDLDITYDRGLLVADAVDEDGDLDNVILVGTAAGHLGWSDLEGEAMGGWDALVSSDGDLAAWEYNTPVSNSTEIIARIAAVLATHLPTETP